MASKKKNKKHTTDEVDANKVNPPFSLSPLSKIL
jgi:hypothetical protein